MRREVPRRARQPDPRPTAAHWLRRRAQFAQTCSWAWPGLLGLGEWYVVVIEPHARNDVDGALIIQVVLHAWLRAGRADAGRRGERTAGRRGRPRATGDAIPRPHRIGQVVSRRMCSGLVRS